ncbi:MAG: hypothetical protein ABIB79_02985 [archaeon]
MTDSPEALTVRELLTKTYDLLVERHNPEEVVFEHKFPLKLLMIQIIIERELV